MRLAACLVLFLSFTFSHAKTLTVGVPEFNPPFVMSSGSGEFIGFDAEIIYEVCRRISAKCVFKTLAYGLVFNTVKSGEADLAIGSITISLNRDQEFLFSLPYLRSFGQFLVKAKTNIYTPEDLIGKRFGIASHSVYQSMLLHQFGTKIQIIPYEFQAQMMAALYNDDVDVLLLDKATADYWYANSDNIYRLLGKQIPYGYGYGILAAKGSEDLISQINTALLSMQRDGTYLRIYSTYFSGDAL